MSRSVRLIALALLLASLVHPIAHADGSIIARAASKTDCACLHGATPADVPVSSTVERLPNAETWPAERVVLPAAPTVSQPLGRAPPRMTGS